MPSQPTAKNELNTNKSTAETICVVDVSMLPSTARSIIVTICPMAPKSISGRRPTRSMSAMAMSDAKKYSVPFAAGIILDLTSSIPSRSNRTV